MSACIYLNKVFLGDSGEEERMERQTSVPSIEPGPSDWEPSAPSTKPSPGTKACLAVLPYLLPVIVDYSVNITLTDHLNLVPSGAFRGQTEIPLHQGRS